MQSDEIQVYMNTWENYNEYGADGVITPAGWMSVDDAIEYCETYADNEPFINDYENAPMDISEYDNASSVLEKLKEFEDGNYDMEIIEAIIEDQGNSLDNAMEIYDSGRYTYYSGVSNDSDLAYAVLDEYDSVGEALGDRINNYIDENQMRREYEDYVREMLRDEAPEQIANENDIDEEDVTDDMIEDYIDENIDTYLDSIVGEDIEAAERGELDLSNYFDYEAYGRDLSFDFTFTANGAISIW